MYHEYQFLSQTIRTLIYLKKLSKPKFFATKSVKIRKSVLYDFLQNLNNGILKTKHQNHSKFTQVKNYGPLDIPFCDLGLNILKPSKP